MNVRKAMAYGRDKGAEDKASAPVLRAAFPKVSQLSITFIFDNGSKVPPSSQTHILYPPSRAYFNFPCPAPGCSGVFHLGPVIEKLVSRKQTEASAHLSCEGNRPQPRASEQCSLHLDYKVEINFGKIS